MTTRNISSSHFPLPFADGSRTDTVASCATCMQSAVVAPKFRRWFVCSASLDAFISHQTNAEAKQILVMLFFLVAIRYDLPPTLGQGATSAIPCWQIQ